MRLLCCLVMASLAAAPLPPAEVYTNLLYWRPNHGGVTYAIVGIPNLPDEAAVVNPESHVGYEVGGRAQLCHPALYLAGRYLAFDTTPQRDSVVLQPGLFLLPTFAATTIFGTINFAEGVVTSRYRTGDLEVGWRWHVPYVLGGLRYFSCTETERYAYRIIATGNILPALQIYSWRGWGPRLAFGTLFSPRFSSWWGVRVRTQAGFTAAIADRRLKILSGLIFGAFGQTDVIYPEQRAINMGFDLILELQGWISVCGAVASCRLGYELDTYLNARTRVDTTNGEIVADRSTSALGYGGPYVGVSIGY